jgi:hypothetical protein
VTPINGERSRSYVGDVRKRSQFIRTERQNLNTVDFAALVNVD